MKKTVYLIIGLLIVGGGIFYFSQHQNPKTTEVKDNIEYNPEIKPEEFSANITNPYFTLAPGKKAIYEAKKEDGLERVEIYVANEKKTILGVETVVVWDRVWLNGSLVEDTKDWYAQHKDGSVWYFGEDSVEVLDGKITSHHGSWEAGVNGAKPGIIMEANPKVGDSYREEYYKGEAEDKADVLSVSEPVTVPSGSYTNCLKTKNYTALEPDVVEQKYYCKEVGNTALEIDLEDDERLELISVEFNAAPSPSVPATEPSSNTQQPKPANNAPAANVPQNPPQNEPAPKTGITEEQAKAIALKRVPGKVTDIAIEQKFGKTTYVVEIDPDNGPETDVVIDISTGEVLAVE